MYLNLLWTFFFFFFFYFAPNMLFSAVAVAGCVPSKVYFGSIIGISRKIPSRKPVDKSSPQKKPDSEINNFNIIRDFILRNVLLYIFN